MLKQLVLAVIAGTLLGCFLGALIIGGIVATQPTVLAALLKSSTPAPSPIPSKTETLTPVAPPTDTPAPPTRSLTLAPSATIVVKTTIPVATQTPGPTRTVGPTRTPRVITPHFWAGRPVPSNASGIWPALFYLYGTTGIGQYDVHHGVEFVNPQGTLLYAVADGTVVTAGSDEQPACGDDGKAVCGRGLMPGGYYGKLVVIQLTRTYNGQRLYALYGHMSKIDVSKGDVVKAGDTIGEIGGTGVAAGGMHVHLEIRVGTNDYAHTRNPVLWLTPLPGRGALAGRITDSRGNLLRGALVDIYRGDNSFLMETETYSRDRWPEVNADDEFGENFAIGDLLAGDYIIRVKGQSIVQRVTIPNGGLSFVEIGGP